MKSKICIFEKMNTDIADRLLPDGVYRNMVNCRVGNLNEEAGGVVKNIKSTLEIAAPAFGMSVEYIGGCLYSKDSSIIAFKRNSSILFITSYKIKTGVETILYKTINKIDCTKRIIHSVVLNDLLYWIDGAGKIRKINLSTISAKALDSLTSAQMMIDKFPPLFPPTILSLTEAGFSGNNITDTTFQFAYCWEYEDKEVSSYSPFSKSVIPYTADEENFPRNAIDVTVGTGDSQVKKIYIAYRSGKDKDWMLAEKLDKSELGILNDTTYAYRFYNDKFLTGLVQVQVLTNTNNPFYWFGALALTKDNFLALGLLKDGLSKPSDISLALTMSILSTTAKIAGYKFGAKHKFGLIFRDENGRTDGIDAITEVKIPFLTEGAVYTAINAINRTTHNPYVNIGWAVTRGGAAVPVNTAFTAGAGSLADGTYYYRVSSITSKGESSPSTETSLAIARLATPVNAAFTAGTGTLAAATYWYRVSAINAIGETLASTETSFAAALNTGINVNWGAVAGATGYKIYGRTTGAQLLIATVGAVTTYLDNGSITPAGALPTANTTAGGINVNWGAISGATGYKIYGRAIGAGLFIATVGTVTTYLDNGSVTPSGALPTIAPVWAKTMSLVYLGNATLVSFVQHVMKDIKDVGIYTYIDISPINTLKDTTSILDPGNPLSILSSYTFTEGDRIRFITNKTGGLLNGTYDYEIKGYVAEITDSDSNIHYEDTIYVSQISNWVALNIGKGSTYEIYTPKKEFSDDIYYETGEVFNCANGVILTTSGNLVDGDVYNYTRDMSSYIIGELVSDKVLGRAEYYYRGNAGLVPKLDVLKPAEGIYAEAMVIPGTNGTITNVYFYKNTTEANQTLTITGRYNIITETDSGCSFVLRHMASNNTVKQTDVIYSVADTKGGTIITSKGNLSFKDRVVLNGEYLYFYFDVPGGVSAGIYLHSPVDISVSVKIINVPLVGSVESRNNSDYWESDEHSYGRPYLELEEDTSTKNNVVNTGKYFVGTDMNQINVIDSLNVKNVPYEHGLITAMSSRGDTLKVLMPDKEISFYLGKEEYMTGGGQRQLALTDSFIGTMRPYETNYGTENPESILVDGSSIYYYDRKNKTIICSSKNGQVDIGRYGAKTYLNDVYTRLNNAGNYNVFIGSNETNDEIFIVFVIGLVAETIVFNKEENAWKHSLGYSDAAGNAPTGMINYGKTFVIYLNSKSYLNEAGTTFNTFFGDVKSSSIQYVFNTEPVSTKVLRSLSYQGLGKWEYEISGNSDVQYPSGTYTKIPIARFKEKEGVYHSDIPMNLKDKAGTVSILRYAKGQPMRGRYFDVTLTNGDTSQVQLDLITITYED